MIAFRSLPYLLLTSLALAFAPLADAALPADIQAKVESYKKKLGEWAASPLIVKAANEANAKGATGMSNAKWDELSDNDPTIQATITGPVSEQLRKWEADKGINKLYLRDQKANVVAGVTRTTLYNAAKRPHIAAALKGEAAHIDEVKPDPSTQVKSVQVAVPVLEAGKVIGVLHTAVTVE